MLFAKNIFARVGLIILSILLISSSCNNQKRLTESNKANENNQYILQSIALLEAVKTEQETSETRKELAEVDSDTLAYYLLSDNQKKAFWINIYNAHIQIFLNENPKLFENRGKFFSAKRITIAGKELSFDDIEHGIIRGSQFKLALGLVKNPFAGEFEKKFRTKKTDGRIHFALNCGAKSCPLVASYDAQNFENKIDTVAQHFLEQVCHYNEKEEKVYVTSLFSWFRGDFGGKSGTLSFLKNYGIIPENAKPSIEYNTYDWTLSLGNYYE